jgi:hypothetical protein
MGFIILYRICSHISLYESWEGYGWFIVQRPQKCGSSNRFSIVTVTLHEGENSQPSTEGAITNDYGYPTCPNSLLPILDARASWFRVSLDCCRQTRGFSFYSFEWELLLPVRFMCEYILAILLGNQLLQPWRKAILASMDLTSTRTTWLSLHSTTTCKSKIARCLKLTASKWIRFSCLVMR